jgi:hypothetical protein
MASDPRPIDYAGYGAIYALHGILVSSLEILVVLVSNRESVDTRPFLAVAEGMITTIHLLHIGSVWSDARLQFLVLAHRYRDLIDALAIAEPEAFRIAAAELSEAQTVAGATLHQLADDLGLLQAKVLSA